MTRGESYRAALEQAKADLDNALPELSKLRERVRHLRWIAVGSAYMLNEHLPEPYRFETFTHNHRPKK